jgi:hypothetical protein
MTRGWTVLVGLVLAASGVPLLQAFVDRGGAPRQTLILSNRELMRRYGRDENSGVQVTWSWGTSPNVDSLTRHQLDSLGIRCPGTGYDCDARSGTRGWIAVGLDTVEWQRSVDSVRRVLDAIGTPVEGDSAAKRRHDEATSRLDQLEFYTSRLRMVGVGRDPEVLAATWNDGKHLILHARLWVYRQTYPQSDRPGSLPLFSVNATPLPGELYVPVEWASAVTDTTGSREHLFAVTVAVGQGWLPRVVGIFPK